MSRTQSFFVLGMIIALAFYPMAINWARRKDEENTRSEPLSSLLPAPEALARHLYGEAVGWSWKALDDYDHSRVLQAEWKREAELQLRQGIWT